MTLAASADPAMLKPSRKHLQVFIEGLFRHATPNGYASLRAFYDDKSNKVFRNHSLWLAGGLDPLVDAAEDDANRAANFPNPIVFCPPIAVFANPDRAREQDLLEGLALSVECDKHPQKAKEQLEKILGPATFVVASGGKWIAPDGEEQEKLHLHWRLSTPARGAALAKLKEARNLATEIAGGDPSNKTIVHPIRWPGSWHRKGEPVPCIIRHHHLDSEIDLAVALSALQAAAPVFKPTGQGKSNGYDTERSTDWTSQIQQVITGENYHAALASLAMSYLRAGMNDGAAVNVLRGLMENSGAERDDRWHARYADIPRAVSTARTKLDGAGNLPAGNAITDAGPGTQWPEPKPLPTGLASVDPFSIEFMPDALARWVEDIADRLQCPPDYVAVAAITALGAVIGRRVGIAPQEKTDWVEIPNLWGAFIGRPGLLKSPAMTEALKPIHRLEVEAIKENEVTQRAYEQDLEAFKLRKSVKSALEKEQLKKGEKAEIDLELGDEPKEPIPLRYRTNDSSYEALGELLIANPSGILVERDELVSLLKHLDRDEQAVARGFYLSGWSGSQPYTFDRIIRGHRHIEAVCLSVLGNTQPARIAEYVRCANADGAGGDGLLQRFGLLVWPDAPPDWENVDEYPDTCARLTAREVFDRASKLDALKIGAFKGPYDKVAFLRFDGPAQSEFLSWRTDLEGRLRAGELSPAVEGHLAKYRKLIPALALINHIADAGCGPVSHSALLKALAFGNYLESHARRVYGAHNSAEVAAAKAILIHIQRGDLVDGFSARDVHQRDWSNLTDREHVQAGLNLLAELDYLSACHSTPTQRGGRPKVTFLITPRWRR